MTTDELIGYLDDEWGALEVTYAALYETLGRRFFSNVNSPTCWPIREAFEEIKKVQNRQGEIRAIQLEMQREIRKLG